MLPELFLHIGTTKTGSTSIQAVFELRRQDILARGVYWPVTHGARRHQLMAASYVARGKHVQRMGDPVWQGMEPLTRVAAYRDEFRREMQGLPKKIDRVVMSAEQFSLVLRTRAEIQALHDYLAPMFSKMHVVIYLRRQDSHYSSMYAQHLRMGNLYQPDLASVKVGYNQDYDYLDLVTRWSDVFGEAAMIPRLFERTGNDKFDVVDDFLALCRLKIEIPPDDDKRARNPSMTVMGQNVLIKTGQLLDAKSGGQARDGFLWNRVSESVTRVLRGQGWLPTQTEASEFLARFAQTNEAVRARWFPERETLFALDFSKLPAQQEPVDAAANFEAACDVLLEAVRAATARELAMTLQIAKMAETAGDPKRTVAALMHILRMDPRNTAVRVQLTDQYIKMGDLKAAAAIYKAAKRLAPEDALLVPVGAKLSELGVNITVEEAPPVRKPKPALAPKPRRKRHGQPEAVAAEGCHSIVTPVP